jgi:hypothetical protein
MGQPGKTRHNRQYLAEAMGGIRVFAKRGRGARVRCEHEKTITVKNAGIERTVCETCGRVSINAEEGLSGTVSRSQFERVVERPAARAQ